MADFFIKDELRAAVEFASSGKQTVIYTQTGHPCVMNVFYPGMLEDVSSELLGTGVFDAFKVDNITRPEIFIGTYLGLKKDGELLSLPNVAPSANMTYDEALSYARANGPGWHVLTATERFLLQISAYAAISTGYATDFPNGNNNYGQFAKSFETGRISNGTLPGVTSSTTTYTGSGPHSWRHDGTPYGVADLNGNLWEWISGIRMVDREIQITLKDNDAASHTNWSQGTTTSNWRALNAQTGAYVSPTFTGSIAGGNYAATTPNSTRYGGNTANHVVANNKFRLCTNNSVLPISAASWKLLIRQGVVPVITTGDDVFYSGAQFQEMMLMSGGSYDAGSESGIFATAFTVARSTSLNKIGARPCYIPPA